MSRVSRVSRVESSRRVSRRVTDDSDSTRQSAVSSAA